MTEDEKRKFYADFMERVIVPALLERLLQERTNPAFVTTDDHVTLDQLKDRLSFRTWRVLTNAGFKTVADVRRVGDHELLKLKHFGRKSLEEARDVMGLPYMPKDPADGW